MRQRQRLPANLTRLLLQQRSGGTSMRRAKTHNLWTLDHMAKVRSISFKTKHRHLAKHLTFLHFPSFVLDNSSWTPSRCSSARGSCRHRWKDKFGLPLGDLRAHWREERFLEPRLQEARTAWTKVRSFFLCRSYRGCEFCPILQFRAREAALLLDYLRTV